MLRARLPATAFAAALLAVVAYVAATGLSARGISGLFPAVVGLVGAAAALVNLMQAGRGRGPQPEEPGAEGAWLAGLSLGVPSLYALLLWQLGFWIASAVVLIGLPWLLGYRRAPVVLGVALGTLLGVYVIFVQVFEMRLPRGAVIERILEVREAD